MKAGVFLFISLLSFAKITAQESVFDVARYGTVQQMENLKLLFEFHTGNRVIKGDPEFEQYINDILDMIAEIEEKLKN